MDQELLDLKGVPCPRNTARALVRMATMDAGESLVLILDDGEPIKNVPSSLEIEGHRIVKTEKLNETTWRLEVIVGGL